jgi:hypothetical protein
MATGVELQILYDKAEWRIEITATVSEAIASAFENKKGLPKEGSLAVLRDIAGAGFECDLRVMRSHQAVCSAQRGLSQARSSALR